MDEHIRTLMRRALLDLRVSSDDGDAVTQDMLRPASKRELGPVLHATNYRDARGKVLASIAFLMRILDDDGGEPGDPSGNGGAGPVH